MSLSMNNKYQIEIQEFEENFKQLKNKKIVLYGIGRYTATLVEGLKGFQIVGLMDKDSANIGKLVFGIPVISKAHAENIADIVVINTSETYWDVIYERISDIKIPVYYKNGVRAKKKEQIYLYNPYNNLNINELYTKIENSEIISFDFFDTLFMRAVCNPRDVFALLEYEIQDVWNYDDSFSKVRNQAIKELDANYSFDELYIKIKEISKISQKSIDFIKEKEIILEKKLLCPRTDVIQILKSDLVSNKEVYLISDMYLPRKFYIDVLNQYYIYINEKHILISNELNKSKSDGSLWEYYSKELVKDRTAIHIGDNQIVDVLMPQKYDIDSYHTPNAWDLLNTSSLKVMSPYICTTYASAVMGCICQKIFNNPYILSQQNGMLEIKSNHDIGYVVFGPVIFTFLMWLINQSAKDNIQKLIFMSRDGYFLKGDYEYVCDLLGVDARCCYLGISRQLAMSASITNDDELMEYISMPYTGSIEEMFEDRLGIKEIDEIPEGNLKQYIEKYNAVIWNNLSRIRSNYLAYLDKLQLSENDAVVDLGFYGNNQRYLNKLINKRIKGYYFNANLSEKNMNAKEQEMMVCFQKYSDLTGEYSGVLKKITFMESLLTAPYGMIKEIDDKGKFICAEKKQNQIYFEYKEEINRGIKEFIKDYINLFGQLQISLDIEFVDKYYEQCMSGVFGFTEEVKSSFYNDNAMMNRIESMLFY